MASWHPNVSRLNISLFWKTIAQAKSDTYRPRSRGGSIGTARRHLRPGLHPSIRPANDRLSNSPAFADRGGFEAFSIFKETASGARNNRLARNRVLELAQARRINAVLVTELSRWGRSTQGLLGMLYKLAGWDVSVVAMSGMTFELDTPHGRMMATMLARNRSVRT